MRRLQEVVWRCLFSLSSQIISNIEQVLNMIGLSKQWQVCSRFIILYTRLLLRRVSVSKLLPHFSCYTCWGNKCSHISCDALNWMQAVCESLTSCSNCFNLLCNRFLSCTLDEPAHKWKDWCLYKRPADVLSPRACCTPTYFWTWGTCCGAKWKKLHADAMWFSHSSLHMWLE